MLLQSFNEVAYRALISPKMKKKLERLSTADIFPNKLNLV